MNNNHDATPEYDALILAIVAGILIGLVLLFSVGMLAGMIIGLSGL